MDPFEEFEIKPLSDGLGFHKKSVPLSEQVKKSGLANANSVQIPSLTQEEREKIKAPPRPDAFADLLKSLESPVSGRPSASRPSPNISNDVMITETLPAPGTAKRKAMEVEIPRPTGPEFPTLNPRPPQTSPLSKVVESVGLKRGAADSPTRLLERAAVSVPAAILDGILVFALSLTFLVALMAVMNVDLAGLVADLGVDNPTRLAFVVLFAAVLLMYEVVVRSLYGRTLGEWTFDYQMGNDQQHTKAVYPLQVFWRAFLVLGTGVITLPLLSLLLRRDLLAPLTGLQLYRSR